MAGDAALLLLLLCEDADMLLLDADGVESWRDAVFTTVDMMRVASMSATSGLCAGFLRSMLTASSRISVLYVFMYVCVCVCVHAHMPHVQND